MSKTRPKSPSPAPPAKVAPPGRYLPAGESWPRWAPWVAAALLFLYAGMFFAQPIAELTRDPAQPWLRVNYLIFLVTVAPEVWQERWLDGGSVALGDRIPIVLAAVLLGGVAWSAGALAMRGLRVNVGLTRLEQFVFASGVGLNLVSLFTLCLGMAGALRYRALPIVAAASVVLLQGWLTWRARRPGTATAEPERTARLHGSAVALLGLCLPFVVVALLGGVLPPSEFDVREYHLQAPKEFFQLGRITFLPHNVYANMPLGTEMHALAGMVLLDDWWRGALVGKLLQAAFLPLTALALFAAGRRWYSTLAGSAAALIYVSTPWMMHVAHAGLVEGAAGFYAFATLYAWMLWRDALPGAAPENQEPPFLSGMLVDRRLLLTGFLAGSAVATKYPAALFVAMPVLGLVLWRGTPARMRYGAIFLAAVAVGCGPWLVKNVYFTGNPTYPLLYEVFGGTTWDAEKNARWQAAHRPANFALASARPGDTTDLLDSLRHVAIASPWLNLLTWPLAAVTLAGAIRAGAARDRRVVLLWSYLGFVLVAWWLFTHRIDRFWIPLLPAASLLAGVGATSFRGRAWWSVVGTVGALALAYDFTAAVTNTGPGSSNRFFVPLAKLRVDPERVPEWITWLNEHTPPGRSVLAEGDAAAFDLDMPLEYHTAFDDSPLMARLRGKTPAQQRAALADVAFVYVNWPEIARYRAPGNYGFTPDVSAELFQELVELKILGPPLEAFRPRGIEIYPVP